VLDVVGQQAPDAENDVPQRCRAISLFTAVLIASPRQRSSHLRYPRLLSLDRAVAKHAGKQGADSGPRVVSGQRVPMESVAATLSFIRSSFYNLSSAGQRRKEFLWKDRQAAGNYPDCDNDSGSTCTSDCVADRASRYAPIGSVQGGFGRDYRSVPPPAKDVGNRVALVKRV
jgi:hypothetical protein